MWTVPRYLENEFESSSDRGTAIIGGAYVEERLIDALRSHLRRDRKIFERLFLHSGPLATFEAKIRIGVLTGLLIDDFAHDLMIIKDVRNRFAHRLDITSFDTDGIRDRLNNFQLITLNIQSHRIVERNEPTARQKFQYAVGEAGGMLRDRRICMMPEPPTFR